MRKIPNPRRQPLGKYLAPSIEANKKRASADELIAALTEIGGEELNDLLKRKCEEKLIENAVMGIDSGVRSIELLAKFKGRDWLAKPAQQTMVPAIFAAIANYRGPAENLLVEAPPAKAEVKE